MPPFLLREDQVKTCLVAIRTIGSVKPTLEQQLKQTETNEQNIKQHNVA